jgi:hypothetical protein
MAQPNEHVKWTDRCLDFVDQHPRLGWYIAILATLNFILNLIDAVDLL